MGGRSTHFLREEGTFEEKPASRASASDASGMWQIAVLFGVALALTQLLAVVLPSFAALISAVGSTIFLVYLASLLAALFYNLLPRPFICPTNKAVLITGCDSGFGFQLAKRLDALGFHVLACCLLPEGDGAKELLQTCSSNMHVLPLDVTKDDSVNDLLHEVKQKLEGKNLWAVVNNAGVGLPADVAWCGEEVYRHMFDVNVFGVVKITKAFLPLLKDSGGRFIFMASVLSHGTVAGLTAYCMSKHAVRSFADGLRAEVRKWGVHVASIEPGLYRTAITDENMVVRGVKKIWDAAPEEVRDFYGKSYIQSYKDGVRVRSLRANPKISLVVDCMVDAVAAKIPKTRYRRCMPREHIQLLLNTISPPEIKDNYPFYPSVSNDTFDTVWMIQKELQKLRKIIRTD